MLPAEFISKWSKVALSERSSSQQHFIDLCRLVGHPLPAEADPTGESFCFERGAEKHGGGDGWADVWKQGHFAIEYKGRHANLDKAYDQLLRYRASLENPPLLVVCDTDAVRVHTNFTGTAEAVHRFSTADIDQPRNLEILRNLFYQPDNLRPGRTSEAITQEAAAALAALAGQLRARQHNPEDAARFLDRVVFCLFAEDVGLLPDGVFTELLANTKNDPERFNRYTAELFAAMAKGGEFQYKKIDHFNGGLFAESIVLELAAEEINAIHEASQLDWGAVDPSIFGTLFQRGLDPSTRAALGAEYTSRRDIEDLIEPVLMAPLRREWAEVAATIDNLIRTGQKKPKSDAVAPTGAALKKALVEALRLKEAFLQRLARVQVLDPACGSGNFLYVSLQELKDFEKEVILYGGEEGVRTDIFPVIGPWQFHGIEINPYAHELAQLSLWIGYLQWHRGNGFPLTTKPILKSLDNFHLMDALLDRSDSMNPKEAAWPQFRPEQEVVIVGNPPFLGGGKLRSELGSEYVEALFRVYGKRLPNFSDLCCYWFEKARALVVDGKVSRVGLLATQAIRGGASREVLKRIKDNGSIFFGVSDRDWILDGANVHISMVGFSAKSAKVDSLILDGEQVEDISASLTAGNDTREASVRAENLGVCFMGPSPKAPFDISADVAREWISQPNAHGVANSDVLRPVQSGVDLTRVDRGLWTIDFGLLDESAASQYEAPFEHVGQVVRPVRQGSKSQTNRKWWQFERPRVELREAMATVSRCIVTPEVSKHRIFVWRGVENLCNQQTLIFACSDDFFFGVLHSRFHEIWSLAQGTQLREKESGFRYTPTTCFETFPFPWDHRLPLEQLTPEQQKHHAAISAAAKNLDDLRSRWLNPPEWTREDVLEFPATAGGPWSQFITEGSSVARYPRLVPKDAECAKQLADRTLTKLYNARPAWLATAHEQLDAAVAVACGLPADLKDEQILKTLLER